MSCHHCICSSLLFLWWWLRKGGRDCHRIHYQRIIAHFSTFCFFLPPFCGEISNPFKMTIDLRDWRQPALLLRRQIGIDMSKRGKKQKGGKIFSRKVARKGWNAYKRTMIPHKKVWIEVFSRYGQEEWNYRSFSISLARAFALICPTFHSFERPFFPFLSQSSEPTSFRFPKKKRKGDKSNLGQSDLVEKWTNELIHLPGSFPPPPPPPPSQTLWEGWLMMAADFPGLFHRPLPPSALDSALRTTTTYYNPLRLEEADILCENARHLKKHYKEF